MTQYAKRYEQLKNLSQKAAIMEGISGLLHWDQETYMPPEGAGFRAEQNKLMAALRHELLCSNDYREVLSSLVDLESGEIKAKDLPVLDQIALRRWQRDWKRYSALPQEFVEEFALVTSQAAEVWKKARRQKEFHLFAPWLDKIVVMNRRKAEYIGAGDEPYDALLDLYEEGMKTAQVATIFDEIRTHLVGLLQAIKSKAQVEDAFLHGHFSASSQLELSHSMLEAIGYNFDRGNLSLTTHPFCSGNHPTDCRVTSRIHESYFMSNIKTLLHEGGHALYNMQLPADQFGSPLGQDVSMGIHESQSRIWEVFIGTSMPFWQHFLGLVQHHYPSLKEVPLESFWKGINKVEPSFIRVEADEVTYPMHVILRFDIERALLNGDIGVREVPELWNAKMQELLGITPPDDAKGCLQDIHWSLGSMGYFPTYLLGNVYAAQQWHALRKSHPEWQQRFAEGDFAFVRNWLYENIHKHGRRYLSAELIEQATHTPLNVSFYRDYLDEKYGAVYGLKPVNAI